MDLSKITKRKEPEKRTTCKLTQTGSDDLDCLMESFGLTHKTIFSCILGLKELFELLMTAAQQNIAKTPPYNVRKTFVIRNDDLKMLNEASQKAGVNRNVLIDLGIKAFAALMRDDRNKSVKKYRAALEPLKALWTDMEKLERKLANILDKDDHFFKQFGMVIVNQMNLVQDLEEEINRSTSDKQEHGEGEK